MRPQDILDWLATPTGLAASSALVVTASALAVSSSSKRSQRASFVDVPGDMIPEKEVDALLEDPVIETLVEVGPNTGPDHKLADILQAAQTIAPLFQRLDTLLRKVKKVDTSIKLTRKRKTIWFTQFKPSSSRERTKKNEAIPKDDEDEVFHYAPGIEHGGDEQEALDYAVVEVTRGNKDAELVLERVIEAGNVQSPSQLRNVLAVGFLGIMAVLTGTTYKSSQSVQKLMSSPAMGIALQTVMPQYQNASLSGGISPGGLLDIQYGSKHGPFSLPPPPPDLPNEPNLSMDWKKFARETVSRPAKPLHISNKPPIGSPAAAKPLHISNKPPIGRPTPAKPLDISAKPREVSDLRRMTPSAELQRPDNRDHALSAVPSCWHGLCLEEDGFHPLAVEQQGTLNTESSRHIDPIYANWFRIFLQSKNNNNNKKVLIANQIKKAANSSPAFIDDMFDVLLPELITKHFAMCVNHATEEKEVFLAQFIFYADALLAYAEIYKPRDRDHCIKLANDMISVIEYFIHHNHMPHAQYIAQKLEMPTEAAELVQQYNGLSIPATWYGLTYENRFRVTEEASRISKQTWRKFTKRDKDVQFVFYQIYLKYLSSYESAVIVMAQYMETLARMQDGQRLLRSVFEDYLPMRLIDVFAATDRMPLYNTAEQRRGRLIEYFQMIDAFVLYASRRRMDMHGMFLQYLYETKGVMEVWIDPDADWPSIEPATEPMADFPSIEPATEPMADFPSIEPATEQMADWPNTENVTEPMANWKPQPNTFSLRSFK